MLTGHQPTEPWDYSGTGIEILPASPINPNKKSMPRALPQPILEARGIIKVLGQPGAENTVLKGIDLALIPGELTS